MNWEKQNCETNKTSPTSLISHTALSNFLFPLLCLYIVYFRSKDLWSGYSLFIIVCQESNTLSGLHKLKFFYTSTTRSRYLGWNPCSTEDYGKTHLMISPFMSMSYIIYYLQTPVCPSVLTEKLLTHTKQWNDRYKWTEYITKSDMSRNIEKILCFLQLKVGRIHGGRQFLREVV